MPLTHLTPAPLLSSLALVLLQQYDRGVLTQRAAPSLFINDLPIVKTKMKIHSWAIAANFFQSGNQQKGIIIPEFHTGSCGRQKLPSVHAGYGNCLASCAVYVQSIFWQVFYKYVALFPLLLRCFSSPPPWVTLWKCVFSSCICLLTPHLDLHVNMVDLFRKQKAILNGCSVITYMSKLIDTGHFKTM